MKKDIEIPESKGIYLAAVREKNEEFQSMEWNAYLINDSEKSIEMVLIVTNGFDKEESTSTMRHSIKILPARSFAKIEFLQDEVLRLNNQFSVTYFADDKMYEKTFLFKKNSVNEAALKDLPIIKKQGILVK
ncbi:MAG: hypothetical protein JJE07_04210 [Flavobacteriaceae bacterium]|nr:hypothetical protein [Flavobacteriaceae bacterium]